MSTSPVSLPPVSVSGLVGGLDFSQITSSLVAVAQVPITNEQNNLQSLQTQLSDYGTLNSKLQALQGAAQGLSTSLGFNQTTASVSDPSVLSVSATSSAIPGSYTLQVQKLATAQQIINKAATAVADPSTSIVGNNGGTFTFSLGSGPQQTVTLNAGATLTDLQNGINNLGTGVVASILNTGTSASPAYRLVLSSTATGASNTISITADTTSLDFLNTTGQGGTDTLQAAQDAVLVLGDPTQNPVTLTRSSNVITDAIAGVTLNLQGTTGTTPVSVNVATDVNGIASNLNALVNAYNSVVTFANTNSAYDPTSQTGGDFVGESTVRTVLTQIQQALTTVMGSGNITTAGQIGIQIQKDGTITVDSATLTKALSTQFTDVQNLIVGQNGTAGIAQQLANAVTALEDPQFGAMAIRQSTLQGQISDLSSDIDQKQQALTQYQSQLNLQFAQLQATIAQTQTQAAYLSALGGSSTTSSGL